MSASATYEPNYNPDNTIAGYVQKDATGKVIGYQGNDTGIGQPGNGTVITKSPAVPGPDYYSRVGVADGTTSPDGSLIAPTVQSVDEIQAAKTKAAQAQIDSLNQYYADLAREQQTTNDKNDRSTAAISTLTGLAGSTEADTAQQATSKQGQQAIDKIKNEQAVAIQSILSKIRDDAVTEARQQRLDYNATVTDSITNRANQAKMQSDALAAAGDHIKNLTAAGVTADGLKATDPTSYDYLLKQYGGDAEALRGAFILNTPQDQILDKRVEGGKYIVARQNPITGKVTVDTLDLGLPTGYSKTIDAGNRILVMPDDPALQDDLSNWISIPKGLTPSDALKANGSQNPDYNGDFAATIDLAANQGGTNDQRAQMKSTLQRFITQGDYPSAYAAITDATVQGLKGTAATTFSQQQNSLGVLNDLESALNAYAKAGGNTDIFKGSADKIQTKIGTLMTDPKYASLAVQLNAAFQNYRLQMTGAAFGAAESAEYASILPAPGNTLDLNLAKLQGAKAYLNSSVESSIRNVVGQGGVEIKKYAEGATRTSPTSASGTKVLVKDGVAFDASSLTPTEYQDALDSGYEPQ